MWGQLGPKIYIYILYYNKLWGVLHPLLYALFWGHVGPRSSPGKKNTAFSADIEAYGGHFEPCWGRLGGNLGSCWPSWGHVVAICSSHLGAKTDLGEYDMEVLCISFKEGAAQKALNRCHGRWLDFSICHRPRTVEPSLDGSNLAPGPKIASTWPLNMPLSSNLAQHGLNLAPRWLNMAQHVPKMASTSHRVAYMA